ncbi:MAG: DNA gyrase/topoisomerase IV subunit A [Salinivirgaceae bacterium]|nr:DNA gyrase/topoisomerase IV subunit A [Salinivirgaceae bacterium]
MYDEVPPNEKDLDSANPEKQTEATDQEKTTRLTGMYQDWFLDYASYVILERAVPHLNDGLKPVHRRILHSMRRMEDGRYNKVANIIGSTMQFHPHGDASIGDALVALGQKELLIDTQGNWGNILTGDNSAAPRYIEARLSKFALDVVFNPKTTEWKLSYDGRNDEPVTLPVKFPLLLAQGVEGIAVGLASKILPHNFMELIDASIKHLKNQPFKLYPDFPTGGSIDVDRYNDGLRGGAVKVRAKIVKEDNKTLKITEIPFGCTSSSIIDSIIKANDKGKIRIKKVDDNTSEKIEILIHLAPSTSPDQSIDALYAFTDCEVSISPNSCVIFEDKPHFLPVSEMLKYSTKQTQFLLQSELQIRLSELNEDWHLSSLEKIFFEERIYRLLEQDTDTWEQVIDAIDRGFDPYRDRLRREITRDDLLKLTDKPVRKISKFDIKKADEHIKGVEAEIEEVENNLIHIVDYTIRWFEQIAKKYGKGRERKTEIRNFENIEANQVIVANEKLYCDFKEGFIGTGLKKDEFICECSDIDDVIAFCSNGMYKVVKIEPKIFIGKDIIHVGIWRRSDSRTTYNAVYRDGMGGIYYVKRFQVRNITRNTEYDITQGKKGSKLLYFTANPNGEAETIRVSLKPKMKLKKLTSEFDFSSIKIKGRQSLGNILTKNEVHKITLYGKGTSTLGGLKIWFDPTVQRLNTEGNGNLLGEFKGEERIVVFYKDGTYSTTGFELTTRFNDGILHVEKMNPDRVYSCIFYEGEQKYYYLKRFVAEPNNKVVSIIGDHKDSYLVELSGHPQPQFSIAFGGTNAMRPDEIIDAEEFIGVKGDKTKGKRLTTYEVKSITNVSPPMPEEEEEEDLDEASSDHDEPHDPESGQLTLDL